MTCMHVICKGLQTLLYFSSCRIKINPEKVVSFNSVFLFFLFPPWFCFPSFLFICPLALYQDTLHQTCKAEKNEARWYRLRSFIKMWMASWPPFMLLPIYSQPYWQSDLFEKHNSVHMILLIQMPFSIAPSITLFCSSVLQVTQALWPEPCLFLLH